MCKICHDQQNVPHVALLSFTYPSTLIIVLAAEDNLVRRLRSFVVSSPMADPNMLNGNFPSGIKISLHCFLDRTQEGEIRKRTFDESKFRANFLDGEIPEHLLDKSSKYLFFHQGGSNNFFSTIFDQVAESPILSAYVITAEHALDIGKFSVRTSYWKDNESK